MDWEVVIGLEIHAQLATKSKIFSGAATAYGAPPNAQACAIDLGLPGVLQVLNAEAVHMAALFGLAIGAEVSRRSVFARKNYFYSDLPKGYQISQYELPIVSGGSAEITVEGEAAKRIGVTRAHLEEDVGKNNHFDRNSGVDFNRAGVPLLEIVSEPDITSPDMAYGYLNALKDIRSTPKRFIPPVFTWKSMVPPVPSSNTLPLNSVEFATRSNSSLSAWYSSSR